MRRNSARVNALLLWISCAYKYMSRSFFVLGILMVAVGGTCHFLVGLPDRWAYGLFVVGLIVLPLSLIFAWVGREMERQARRQMQ